MPALSPSLSMAGDPSQYGAMLNDPIEEPAQNPQPSSIPTPSPDSATGASSSPSNAKLPSMDDVTGILGSTIRDVLIKQNQAPIAAAAIADQLGKGTNWNNTEIGEKAGASLPMHALDLATDTIGNAGHVALNAAKLAGKGIYGLFHDPAPETEANATAIPALIASIVGKSQPPPSSASTPAAPQPTPSNPSALPPKQADPVQAAAASVVAQSPPPAPKTDLAGYADAPGDQSRDANNGVGNYREAQPVGMMFWRDLPPERQNQILAQNPGVQGIPQLYDQTVIQNQGSPLTIPNSPDIANQEAFYGLPISRGNAVDAGALAEARGNLMRGAIGGGGSAGSGLWRINPGTGNWEPTPEGLQPSPIDPHINRLDQAGIDKLGYDYRQAKEVSDYAQVEVPFKGMVNIIQDTDGKGKDTTNQQDNDLIAAAARVQNPGGVVRPTNVDFEQSKRGWSDEVWAELKGLGVTSRHGGKLTAQDRHDMLQSANESYQGLYTAMQQQREIAKQRAAFAYQKGADPAAIENHMLGPQLPNLGAGLDGGPPADGSIPAQGSQQGIPQIASKQDYEQLPSGTSFIGPDGKQWTKP